ncbi:MAG TPA: VOC family protein, partial [Steroidobacteraceae bacterium]|nr:VOC family protein [Steroidobacteraceae bacterium]
MQASPHLHFKGNCIEAFRFYADTFGGEIEIAMTYGESPAAEHTPAEFRDKIIHARINLNGPR